MFNSSFPLHSIISKEVNSLFSFLFSFISIPGVAYTSQCFPCKPGTFSQVPGSSTCQLCHRDTFSGHGASSCTPCNSTTQYAGRQKLKERDVHLIVNLHCSQQHVTQPKNRKRACPIFSYISQTLAKETCLFVLYGRIVWSFGSSRLWQMVYASVFL